MLSSQDAHFPHARVAAFSACCVNLFEYVCLQVAVKTRMFRADPAQSSTQQQAAIREAAVALSLVHPNVLTTYHFDVKAVQELPDSALSTAKSGISTGLQVCAHAPWHVNTRHG